MKKVKLKWIHITCFAGRKLLIEAGVIKEIQCENSKVIENISTDAIKEIWYLVNRNLNIPEVPPLLW